MRLFFAYWPSASEVEEILPWARNAHALYGGRMMRADTLHMTLAFLGETAPPAISQLADACAGWRLPTGSMLLREPGCFPRAKVVWLGPAADAGSLEWLHQAHARLWACLAPLGWQPRESAFRPHVSLLRNAAPASLDRLTGPAITWTPGRCVLVGSQPTASGSRYTELAEVPLEPSAI